jgi:hypothetical protein
VLRGGGSDPRFGRSSRKFVDDCIRYRAACGTSRSCPRARNVRPVIRYEGNATIRQGKTVIEGDCVVESGAISWPSLICRGLDASTILHPGRAPQKDVHGYASATSPSVRRHQDHARRRRPRRRRLNRLRRNRQPALTPTRRAPTPLIHTWRNGSARSTCRRVAFPPKRDSDPLCRASKKWGDLQGLIRAEMTSGT